MTIVFIIYCLLNYNETNEVNVKNRYTEDGNCHFLVNESTGNLEPRLRDGSHCCRPESGDCRDQLIAGTADDCRGPAGGEHFSTRTTANHKAAFAKNYY